MQQCHVKAITIGGQKVLMLGESEFCNKTFSHFPSNKKLFAIRII